MRTIGSWLGALALAVVVALPVSAQDTSHPAGIYVGSCPVPGNQLVSLWDVSPNFLVGGEADAREVVGTTTGFPVEGSVTIVEAPLEGLVGTEHAIVVHRSQAAMDEYLVCGDIGGVMVGADELPVALAPVGVSAWSGIALLDDEGNGTTTVSVWIYEGVGSDTGAGDGPAAPVAAPTRSPESTFDDGPDDDDDDDGSRDERDDGDDDGASRDASGDG